MTEITRLRVQEAKMVFLRRVAGVSLRDRVRSSVRVEPLLISLLREVFQAHPTGPKFHSAWY